MASHRQFVPYQANIAIAPISRQAERRNCQRCSSPIASNHRVLCDLCWSILESLATPYWVRLQHEWIAENRIRIAIKARLLSCDMEGDSGYNPPQQA